MTARTANVTIDAVTNTQDVHTFSSAEVAETLYKGDLVGNNSASKIGRITSSAGITEFEGVVDDTQDVNSAVKVIRRAVWKAVVDSSVANCNARQGFRLLSAGSSPTLAVSHRGSRVWATGGAELDMAPADPTNAALAGHVIYIDTAGGDGTGVAYVLLDADWAKAQLGDGIEVPPATLAAAGSSQSDAGDIVAPVTYVTASDGDKGVKLPTAVAGARYTIYNTVAQSLLVYPNTGDDINDQTTNEAVVIGGKTTATFTAVDATTWAWMPSDQATEQEITADDSESALNTILPNATTVFVDGVTNGANDFIVLPALADVPNGHKIMVIGSASSNFEVRTPASSAEEINSEDCDGTKEYLFTDTQIHYFIKINSTIGWMGHGFSAIGAVVTAVVPD